MSWWENIFDVTHNVSISGTNREIADNEINKNIMNTLIFIKGGAVLLTIIATF